MQQSEVLFQPPTLQSLTDEGKVALFLDFDGTLVELAPGPDAIKPKAGLQDELCELSENLNHRLALVSGRGLDDIATHIGPLRIAGAGSHGTDIRDRHGDAIGLAPEKLPASIEDELRSFAASNALNYEHKPHGGALHFRSDPNKGGIAEAFARELAERNGWSIQTGKCVVELVKGGGDKGTAVAALMQTEIFTGAMPIFLGDDLTDEKGFAQCNQMGGFGIFIGEPVQTYARYQLPDVASVHAWLGLEGRQ